MQKVTSISSAENNINEENKNVKILTPVKTKSKDLSKIQQFILTKIRKSKKALTNCDLATDLKKSKQTISYNVRELIKKNLIYKHGRLLHEIKSQNSHVEGVEGGIHRLFFKIPLSKYSKSDINDIKWKTKSKLNGIEDFWLDTTFDTNDIRISYFQRYGKLNLTYRIMLSKKNCFFFIYFKKPKMISEDYKQEEDSLEELIVPILSRFNQTYDTDFVFDFEKKEKCRGQHYKICDLTEEFEDFNYKDDQGLTIDCSEGLQELEHEQRKKAQFISDLPNNLPKTIEELKSKIRKSEDSHMESICSFVESVERRFAEIMKFFSVQDKESEVQHKLLQKGFEINIA